MAKRKPKADAYVRQILEALEAGYGADHPRAVIEAYRYNPASIRIRIIDPAFKGLGLLAREEKVWPIIEGLPDDVKADISVLLLIPPEERKTSLMSEEFDDPAASHL